MPTIETIADERVFSQYIAERNRIREMLVGGVYANIDVTDRAYDELTISLAGGNETLPDLSVWADYHSSTTAAIAPFIAAIRASMDVIHDGMQAVNTLAVASGQDAIFAIEDDLLQTRRFYLRQGSGQDAIFAIEDDGVTVQSYIAILQTAITTLQATATALAQLGG